MTLHSHFFINPDNPYPITDGNLSSNDDPKPSDYIIKHQRCKPYYIEWKGKQRLINGYILIVTELNKIKPKLHLFHTPIKHVLHISPKLLKILFQHGYITQGQVELAYNKWVSEESEIIFDKYDHRMLLHETVRMPVKRRGNEHYHKHTWSRIQWYQMVFDSKPVIVKESEKKKKRLSRIKKIPINSKIHYLNTFFVTLTYPESKNIHEYWNNTTQDLNRFFTNLKGRLKRRDNNIYFYFKALESQNNGMPHVHILIKLENPIECYQQPSRKGTYYTPFNKKLFDWRYGFYDIKGINNNDAIKYVTKYITKVTSQSRTRKENKTLALTWMSSKRLYSTSMFDIFKYKYPNSQAFISSQTYVNEEKKTLHIKNKCTVNNLVDDYWNGFKLPLIPWDKGDFKKRFRYPIREQCNRNSEIVLKAPLETRLNKEGYYQVSALRILKPKSGSFLRDLKRISKAPEHKKQIYDLIKG